MVILKGLLSEQAYNHFMLLSVACRILSSRDFYKIYHAQAKNYLKTFVKAATHPDLYGPKFLVINDHNLTHLADDVENLDCPVMDYSAFCSENALKTLKDCIECGNKPLAQVVNKIQDNMECEKPVVQPEFQAITITEVNPSLFSYKRMHSHGCELSLDEGNNVVSLTNGEMMRIESMTSNCKNSQPSQIVIKGTKIKNIGPAFTYPCNSSILDIHAVTGVHNEPIQSTLNLVQHKLALFKICKVPGEAAESYAMALLHMN
ncbi:hypothetical protein QAD02_003411 [Eretmocerus hayati]|uniref:Uncharacterized protein n=1 Tax=Eretmocerus hayati TaxID=131215 RepID=A0ACC2NM14_9HYME|nr:hypothetical protein QAD02_003411 [Eretmocerus hayati]